MRVHGRGRAGRGGKERGERGGVLGALLFWGAALVAGGCLVALHVPTRVLFGEETRAIDPGTIEPEIGLAWLAPLQLDLPTGAEGGASPVRVSEDGLRFDDTPLHETIRSQGGARASHWGPWLRFATTDGSDPRTNGRTYLAHLPAEVPERLAPVLAGAALVALLVVLAGCAALALRTRRMPLARTAAALLVAAGAAVTAWQARDVLLLPVALDRSLAGGTGGGEPVAHAATRGNTTRLLLPDVLPELSAAGTLPPARDPAKVVLAPEDGVPVRDGLVRLLPGGPGLRGAPDRPLRMVDVAELVLPVQVSQATTVTLQFFDHSEPPRVLHELQLQLAASDGWQHLRLSRPLALAHASGSPLTSLRLVCADRAPEFVGRAGEVVLSDPLALYRRATHGLDRVEVGGSLRPCVWQSVPGELSLPLPASAGGRVKGSLAALGSGGTARWRVLLEDGAGQRHPVASGEASPGQPWTDVTADLPLAPPGGRLLLVGGPLAEGTVLAWTGWRAVDTARPPRHVVMFLLDTLRADALSSYGGPGATPTLDALAADGVRFSRCYSQSSWTRPSMPSIMTGRYVGSTGVHTVGQRLPAAYTTIAEAFAADGFHTLATIANTNAGPDAGLDQGFDETRLTLQGPLLPDARALLEQFVLPRLSKLTDEDLLVSVHLMDAHGPYGPYEEPADWSSPGGAPLPHDKHLDQPWTSEVTDAGRRALYHADVERMDAGIGWFLEQLEVLWEGDGQPLVAVMADHGEYLGEYGQWGHSGFRLVPEVNHVPLIVRAPGLPRSVVVDAPVENIDVAPTLLDLCGLDVELLAGAEGRSLVPLVRDGDRSQHGPAIATLGEGRPGLFSVFAADRTLVGSRDRLVAVLDREGNAPLENPRLDDIAVRRRAGDGTLLGALSRMSGERTLLKAWERHAAATEGVRAGLWTAEDAGAVQLDAVALQQLRAMGYLDG